MFPFDDVIMLQELQNYELPTPDPSSYTDDCMLSLYRTSTTLGDEVCFSNADLSGDGRS